MAEPSLVEWLSACLDSDERTANLMAEFYPGTWEIADRGYMARIVADGPSFWEVTRLEQWPTMPTGVDAPTLGQIVGHVERWQPARVLAEVAAKRRIIEVHYNMNDGDCAVCVRGEWGYPTHGGSSPVLWPCLTVRLLALPYAGRDGYQDSWRPE